MDESRNWLNSNDRVLQGAGDVMVATPYVRQVFEGMAAQSASVALVGRLGAWNSTRLETWARRAGGRARSGRRTAAR